VSTTGAYRVTDMGEEWSWECHLCSWTGWNLYTKGGAHREARRHLVREHQGEEGNNLRDYDRGWTDGHNAAVATALSLRAATRRALANRDSPAPGGTR
jgi:hypothetical protein